MNAEQARAHFKDALTGKLDERKHAQFEALLADDALLCAEFERFADSAIAGPASSEVANLDRWLHAAGAQSRKSARKVKAPSNVMAQAQRAPAPAGRSQLRRVPGRRMVVPRRRSRLSFLALPLVAATVLACLVIWLMFAPAVRPTQNDGHLAGNAVKENKTDAPKGKDDPKSRENKPDVKQPDPAPKQPEDPQPEAPPARPDFPPLPENPPVSPLERVELPPADPGSIESLPNGARYVSGEGASWRPLPGAQVNIGGKATVALENAERAGAVLRVHDGEVRVRLDAGTRLVVAVGDATVSALGPADFTVTVAAKIHSSLDVVPTEIDPMHKPRSLARFGAAGVMLTLSITAGSADLRGAGFAETLSRGDVVGPLNAQHKAPKPPKGPPPAPKPEDVFNHLDADGNGTLDATEFGDPGHTAFDDNKDGVVDLAEFKAHFKPPEPPKAEDIFKHFDKDGNGTLDAAEVDAKMLKDFDDNGDGVIDETEFKNHFKSPPHPHASNPEDIFKHHDKNGDGKLDATEVDARMINDFDDDGDGVISLDEFKKHFKPPHPPSPEDAFKRQDKNNDGVLDGQEIDPRLLKDLDKNNDGVVDLTEFKQGPKGPPTPQDVFKHMDKDGDGKISLQEWKDAHKPPPAEDMFKQADTDGDGYLDAREADPQFIQHADADGDGKVSLDEFKKVAPKGPDDKQLEDMFKQLDTDKDGSVSQDEFKKGPMGPPPGGPGMPGGPRPPKVPGGGPNPPPGGPNPPGAPNPPPGGPNPPAPPKGQPPAPPPAPPGGGPGPRPPRGR